MAKYKELLLTEQVARRFEDNRDIQVHLNDRETEKILSSFHGMKDDMDRVSMDSYEPPDVSDYEENTTKRKKKKQTVINDLESVLNERRGSNRSLNIKRLEKNKRRKSRGHSITNSPVK